MFLIHYIDSSLDYNTTILFPDKYKGTIVKNIFNKDLLFTSLFYYNYTSILIFLLIKTFFIFSVLNKVHSKFTYFLNTYLTYTGNILLLTSFWYIYYLFLQIHTTDILINIKGYIMVSSVYSLYFPAGFCLLVNQHNITLRRINQHNIGLVQDNIPNNISV